MSRTKTYKAWINIKSRCNNPNATGYYRYGGRGISICDEWNNSFEKFFEHFGEIPAGLSVDRIDNDGDYTPENTRLATWNEQAVNKSDNHYVLFNGELRAISEVARVVGIKENTLLYRLRRGWTNDEAIYGKKKEAESCQQKCL